MIWAQNCVKWLWRWCTSKFTKTSAGFDELWNKLLVYHWGRGKLRHMWVDMNEWKPLWCCHTWLTSRVVSYKYSSLVVAEWMQDIRTMLCFPDSPLILWRLSLILLMAAALNDIQRETEASSFFSEGNIQFLKVQFQITLSQKYFFLKPFAKKIVLNFYFWNIQTETLPMAQRNQRLRAFTKSNCF